MVSLASTILYLKMYFLHIKWSRLVLLYENQTRKRIVITIQKLNEIGQYLNVSGIWMSSFQMVTLYAKFQNR
jgi:hypothetical protein